MKNKEDQEEEEEDDDTISRRKRHDRYMTRVKAFLFYDKASLSHLLRIRMLVKLSFTMDSRGNPPWLFEFGSAFQQMASKPF